MSTRGTFDVNDDSETLRQVLRRLPAPEPRPGFVDRVLANAVAAHRVPARSGTFAERLRLLATRRETWIGAVFGGALAAALALILLYPLERPAPHAAPISLALNEARAIDVLIDSERDLEDATIRIYVSGGIALEGFEGEREIGWQTQLERGSNLLSLPVVARSTGSGRLIAVIEHEGRTRRMTVDLTVHNAKATRS